MECPRCKRDAPEVAYSIQAGGDVCERCYGEAAALSIARKPVWREPQSRKDTPYEALRAHVEARLAEPDPDAVFELSRSQVAAYCPACHGGTLTVEFLKNPARVRFGSRDGGPDRCSEGCSAEAIARALE